MSHTDDVPQPFRKTDYRIRFATHTAEKGWRDLVATSRNAAVAAWEHLTATPTQRTDDCYPLAGRLATIMIDGQPHQRWQYKSTRGGRIWYAIVPAAKGADQAGIVMLERVETGHPNETIKNFR